MNNRLSSFLNASRWIAAVLVLISHLRDLVMAVFSNTHAHGLLIKVFYFATGLGREAVIVFFVISGYLVGGLAVNRYAKRGFDLVDYVLHRASRIYTVLIAALLVGLALDLTGTHALSAEYQRIAQVSAISNNLTPAGFFGNLAMLEGFVVDRLGSNRALWSLSYEWWYYCLFAAAMVVIVKGGLARRILAGVALCLMVALLPHRVIIWGLMWLIGVGVAVYGKSALPKPPLWLGLLSLALAIVGSRVGHADEIDGGPVGWIAFRQNLGMAIGYSMLLLAFHKDGRPLLAARWHDLLAGFSYTLYLVHLPMMVFCFAILERFGVTVRQQPGLASFGTFIALGSFLLLYAWAFSLCTEARTPRIRHWLNRVVRRKADDPLQPAKV